MKLLSNWREVLTKAWSFRFSVLSALAIGADAAFPFLDGYLPIPQKVFAALAFLFAALAAFSRLIAQSDIPPK